MDEHVRELRVLVDYRADLIKRRTGLISDPPRKNCWMLAQHARDHTTGQDAAHCWASPPKPADPPGDPAAGPRYRLVARRRMADRYHPVEPASAAGADYRLSDSGPHEAGFVGEYHGLDAVP